PVQTWSLADLGVAPEQVGASAAWSQVTEVTARPPRSAGTIVTDEDGSGAAQLVEFLSANKFL
ncbi:MAG TPA: electron transfer flavoprotein subunit beta, partial [Kribbellaceae bacterium]